MTCQGIVPAYLSIKIVLGDSQGPLEVPGWAAGRLHHSPLPGPSPSPVASRSGRGIRNAGPQTASLLPAKTLRAVAAGGFMEKGMTDAVQWVVAASPRFLISVIPACALAGKGLILCQLVQILAPSSRLAWHASHAGSHSLAGAPPMHARAISARLRLR